MPASTPSPRTRSTADGEPTAHAEAVGEVGQLRAPALAPQPDLGRDRSPTAAAASATTGRDASISAWSCGARADRSGHTAGLPVRSCGGTQSASAHVARHHDEVAVLDAGVEADAVAPVAERGVERGDDRVALLAREVAGREVDHRAVGADRDEVAAVRDLVGRELDAHRRGLDRRAAGVEHLRVVAEDREVADVAARRQVAGDHVGPTDLAARRERLEVRHRRRLERECARRARRPARRRNRRERARRTS